MTDRLFFWDQYKPAVSIPAMGITKTYPDQLQKAVNLCDTR